MEEEWIADRAHLRQLLHEKPHWKNAEYATQCGRSLGWVKKWKLRLAKARSDDDSVLHSRSRARHRPPLKIGDPVVAAILALRDAPPENLMRIPGPRTIIYYLQKNAALREAGWHLPTSTSTIWRILDQHQRILRPPKSEHNPLERPDPMAEWQVDFKEVTVGRADSGERRGQQIEVFNVVDAGTSILVDNLTRTDFSTTTVIETVVDVFRQHGMPPYLRFDRDPRFVGSASGRDFPAAFIRFLYCLGVKPLICPPRRPDKNPFVERYHRSYKNECILPLRPTSVADLVAINAQYRQHYNYERPHQGIGLDNQPPCVAFPDLPRLTAPPAVVDPDKWVDEIGGRYYRRRVQSSGTIQVGRQRYYISTNARGKSVVVTVKPDLRLLLVMQGRKVIRKLPLKGLHDGSMPFERYVKTICREAKSEYQRSKSRKVRYQ